MKKEKVDNLFDAFVRYVKDEVSDSQGDPESSYYGFGALDSEEKLKKRLYEIFNIEIEEEEEG